MATNKYEELGLQLFEDSYDFPADSLPSWEFLEAEEGSTGVVDGVGILGRAVGPFFVVDAKSQNNRFYERKLWERVVGDAKNTIGRGQMLGTIGHGQPLDDAALLEGKVSHRVSKLWIDENKKIGMGEMLILNTPAGRTLNAYLRGGVEFPVSSRGYGKYSGQMEDGTRVVDSESYKLETFDFVRVPGIPTAIPRLVEEKCDDDDDDNKKKGKDTKKKSLPDFLKDKKGKRDDDNDDDDKDALRKKKDNKEKDRGGKNDDDDDDDADESLRSNRKQQLEEVTHQPQVEHRKVTRMEDTVLTKMTEEKIRLEENLRQTLDTNSRLQETITALKGQVDEYQTALNGYRTLGSTEDISRVMDVTETMLHNRPVEESDFVALREQLDVYEELGTPEELEALFDKFEVFMNQYEELGTPADLDKALNTSAQLLEGYSELGSPLDINEAFDSVETFMGEMTQLGTVAELHAVCDLLEAYQEFGTPAELKRAFEMMNVLVDTTQNQHLKAEGKAIAAEYGVAQAVAESMIGAMGAAKARQTLGSINESRTVTNRYVAPRRADVKNEGTLNEDTEKPYSAVSKTLFNNTATSRGERLIHKMSR